MSRQEGQKAKLLVLKNILERKTDEDHPLSVPQLIRALEAEGIRAERKSIYNDIEALRASGVDVELSRGRGGGYYLGSRTFELPELKLLVDAVQASQFITKDKSKKLIRKLEGLTSEAQARKMQRQVFVSGRVKTMNESIYYNVDALHRAIAEDRQVRFVYQEWDLNKRKVARRGGSAYEVSPWALLWEDENYYLVAWAKGQGLRHYRVDKMASITLLDVPRQGAEDYDPKKMQDYAKPMFQMYAGPVKRVQLACDNGVIGPMLDRFGTDVTVVPQPDGATFHLYADVAVSPTFYGWVCGFSGKVRIVAPAEVKEDFCRALRSLTAAEEAL